MKPKERGKGIHRKKRNESTNKGSRRVKVTYTQQAKVTEGGQQGRAYEEQGKGEYSYRKTRNEREIKESASYLRVR